MSVGSKLAGLIFGVAVLIVIILLILSSPLLQIFKMEPIFMLDLKIEVSSLISAIAILILVWERIRESLGKSLESIQRDALQGLYTGTLGFRFDQQLFYNKEDLKKTRDDLESYGRFLGLISLYPKKLPEKMDGFLSLHNVFSKNLQEIEVLAHEKVKVRVYRKWLWHYLGLEPVELSDIDEARKRECKEIAQTLQEQDPQLVNQTRYLHEKLKGMRKEIYEDLEHFFKINHLPDLLRYR